MGIEDCAVLSELLSDERIQSGQDLHTALAVYDNVRRERGQWLVRSSRRIGDCYEWRANGVGQDFKKIEAEINHRNGIIANVDVKKMCEEARTFFESRLRSRPTNVTKGLS